MSLRLLRCIALVWIYLVNFNAANVQSKVRCSENAMEIDIVRSSPQARIYLAQLKDYPDKACKPKLDAGVATFHLSLLDEGMSRCGLMRVLNTVTGQKVYYHRVIVEEPSSSESSKHIFTVKCIVTEVVIPSEITSSHNSTRNHTVTKRSVLPSDFYELDVFDTSEKVEENAPMPILGVGVRQGGTLVTGELNVSPGTPLQMEIYLDPVSAPIYGIIVTHMQVSDTRTQEETIIFNGCSVDPYLFENFNTIDGDFLNAKFRAFKFPESTYVQFRGTVNVCVEKCPGVECSNGQFGFGRKKREISSTSDDKKNLFEITMFTLIKVDFENATTMDEDLLKFVRRGKNINEPTPVTGEEVREKFMYKVIESESNGCGMIATNMFVILFCLLQVF